MTHIETNVYMIKNLEELNCRYKTYLIRGIPDSEDYHKNIQLLVDKLSRTTKSPCVLFTKDQRPLIAQPEDYTELPDSIELIRTTAKIEKLPKLYELNFNSLNTETAKLASRFLQFALQGSLYNNPTLWQPQPGYPFYYKSPDREFMEKSETIDLFRGFIPRIVNFQEGKIGICVDTRSKYVSRDPLPTDISLKEFRDKYKGQKCIYEYGVKWYEIKLAGFIDDLNVSQVKLPEGESLFDHIHRISGLQKSQNLRMLPRDCSVLVYYTEKEEKRVPSGLCRLTYSTDHPDVKPFHSMTIKPPYIRREEIRVVVNRYLRDLRFGSTTVSLSGTPLTVDYKRIKIPELAFGNNKILTVQDGKGSIETSLEDFPLKKKELYYSRDAGIFVRKPFDRQYFIMPQSIFESFGEKFIEDIKYEAQRACPEEEGMIYSPIVIPYNDSVQRSMYNIAKEIMRAVDEIDIDWGFGIVMIPKLPSKKKGKEDQLANFLMRKLRERSVYVSIIHTETPIESYEFVDEQEGWELVSDSSQRGRYKGYVSKVVLNKILITNNIWPFVLKTPLHADLTVGMDVKNNMVGFTLIYKSGAEIKFTSSPTEQREQIGKQKISAEVYEMIKEDLEKLPRDIRKIVVHRQGTLFPPEKLGFIQAFDRLAKEGLISQDYQRTFVEIKTTSRIPFRLFEVTIPLGKQKEMVYNPIIGVYDTSPENEAFICTTGHPYKHKGTTNPLHVVRIDGEMPLESILDDVFSLSNLTWTKIDDCSRLPLSIKMIDIRLREIAGEYDRDAIEFGEEEE